MSLLFQVIARVQFFVGDSTLLTHGGECDALSVFFCTPHRYTERLTIYLFLSLRTLCPRVPKSSNKFATQPSLPPSLAPIFVFALSFSLSLSPRPHQRLRSPFLETPAWLQRRPTSGSRWLAGWRAGVAAQENTAGAGHQPLAAQLHQPAEAAEAAAAAAAATDRWSKAAAKLAKLRRAGQGLGKETRQRGQKINKTVRSGASSFLAHGLSSSRRRSRRRMEA